MSWNSYNVSGIRKLEAYEAGMRSFDGSFEKDLNPRTGRPFAVADHANERPVCVALPSQESKYALVVISKVTVRVTVLSDCPLIVTDGTAMSITEILQLPVLHTPKKLQSVTAKL